MYSWYSCRCANSVGIMFRIRLPTSGPNSVPVPPISAEVSSWTDRPKTKVSELMKPFWWAKNTPPSPAQTELSTKASTFQA